jgi:ABC-type sugar transport system substrate-binding protein
MLKKSLILAAATALALAASFAPSAALEDPTRSPYYAAFKGKTVAYLPISMAANITASWAAGVKRELEPLGVKFVIRDGNFNIDATAQAITTLIDQKVDVMIVQNTDVQAFAKLYKKAQAAGIYVIQVGMQSVVQTDGYSGPDWSSLGEKMAAAAIKQCGNGSGRSGKVALVQGAVTSANGIFITQAIDAAFKAHPEMKIVANQGSDWDPSKAHAIAATALQQNPDLCAFLGYWEDEDQGIVAAVKEAGKVHDVFVMTSGIGEKKSCDEVADGSLDLYYSYDSRTVAQQVVDTISSLLQAKPAAGSTKVLQITPLVELTKASVTSLSCWSLADYVGNSLK